ncbi:hypothetical protein HARCEL1_10395 [Halococcoides cellulosivorans]|uniref:EF-hand domain-containing protein n=2 Tax=Halococcoides cellulosivorans TaxID=1679096 RepID=A0A2R4X2R7_9EURY|nr:hypothetical protein HARCEL1_10395 [Halococcoides cellulosivorans]
MIALVALAVIGAGVAATPAAADATAVDETDADANLTSGQVYWEGQTVRIDADPTEHANATWAVFTSEDGEWGDFVTEIALDASGAALIDTADLTDHDSNSFVVTNETGTAVQFTDGAVTASGSVTDSEFSVLSQAFTASASDSVLENGESTTIDISTNRAGFDLDISANDVSSAELASIFAGNGDAVIGNDDTITVTGLSNTDDLNADLSGLDPGDYSFTFDVTDTSASATVSITVEPSTDEVAAARFLTSGQRYWTGQTVSFDSGSVASGSDDVVRIYTVEDDTVGTLVSEVLIDADGTRLLDTETDIGGQGEYVIGRTKTDLFAFDADGDASEDASVSDASFSVVDQGLSTSFDEDSVTTGETASMTLTSNRAIYSVEISSPDATDAEIERIFGGTTVNVSGGSLDADVEASDVAPGEYTFTFDVVDSAATDTASVTIESTASVELPDTSDVDRGDVASIPVELDSTDTAYVAIGRMDGAGFRTIVEVNDGSDDGEVILEANTYNMLDHDASMDDKFWTADDDDSVENVWYNSSDFDEPVLVGGGAKSHDVRAGSTFDTSNYELGGDTDSTVMRVYERSTHDLSMWTTPTSVTLDSVSAVESSRPERRVKEWPTLENRTAVVKIEASGLEGAIRAADGETTADRFASLVADDVVEFGPKRADVTNPVDDRIDLESDGAHVATDYDNETVYVVMDPEARSLSGDSLFEFAIPEESVFVPRLEEPAAAVQTDTFRVTDRTRLAPGSGSLAVENATVAKGDVATIPIEVGDNDRVSVRLGSEYAGWERVVRVEDVDGDGQVTLRVNTFTAAADTLESSGIEAIGADEVRRFDDQYGTFSGALGTGLERSYAYTVAVHEAYNASGDRFVGEYGVGRLNVEPRTTTGMNVWTAPNDADIETADDVATAISEDHLTESRLITEGDYAVAELEATGIFGALEAQPGNTYAEMLISLDENVDSLNFTVEEGVSNMYEDNTVNLSANTAALTVIPNQDDGTLYVLMDTSAFDGVADGDQRVPTFTVNAGDTTDTLATSDENDVTVEQAFEMESPTVEFDQNDVSAAPGQTISGTTNFAPGTELTIALESQSTPYSPSVETEFTATVQADGTWSGQVDFSDGSRGQEYTVSVIEPDVYAAYEDEIGRPVAAFDGVTTTADTVTVEGVNLSEGGFVVVKTGSATGSFAGVSGYLDPGHHSGVEIPVDGVSEGETVYAVAHTDANGNEQYDGDGAYENADGSPVSERATVSSGLDWPTDPAPTDPDGDGLYEDVSGDGDLNFPDVNALFQNTTSDAVQNNVQYFDFDGDGVVGLQDVLALFEMV